MHASTTTRWVGRVALAALAACQPAPGPAPARRAACDRVWYRDGDGDGVGSGAAISACLAPAGHVGVDGDCDDADPAVSPGAIEVCDADATDEDCDGLAEAADPDSLGIQVLYLDQDGDGVGAVPIEDCPQAAGRVSVGGDCDDRDPLIRPGAREVCNGVDDDCDGLIDDADGGWDPATGVTAWVDGDGDGYGRDPVTVCGLTGGLAAEPGDCDDADPSVHPGAIEVCRNGVDDDCDGGANGCSAYAGEIDLSGAPAVDLDAGPWWAAGGDLDGDGIRDGVLAVDGAGVFAWSGDRFTGARTSATIALPDPAAAGGGVAVADATGDGFDDLITFDAGCDLTVFAGPLSAVLSPASADRILAGADSCGPQRAPIGVGDASGDGVADLLLAEQRFADLHVVLGPVTAGDLDDRAVARLDGLAPRESAAALLLDLDGDGLDDVVTGSPYAGGGAVWIFSGAGLRGTLGRGDADARIESAGAADRLAWSLDGGDLDGDGYGDLVVSALYDAHFVFSGPLSGATDPGAAVAVLRSLHAVTGEGGAFVLGDLNGDGADELMASFIDPAGGDGAPWGFLYSGPLSGTLGPADADATRADSGAQSMGLYRHDRVGDLDGDGFDDVLTACGGGRVCLMRGGGW